MWGWKSISGINTHHSWYNKINRNNGGENSVGKVESFLLLAPQRSISLKNQGESKPVNDWLKMANSRQGYLFSLPDMTVRSKTSSNHWAKKF